MENRRTLKEIALELLEEYEGAEMAVIYEYSTDISQDLEELQKKISSYKKETENAKF